MQFQKARQEVLNRVRSFADLPLEQRNDWQYFVATWDSNMAEEHGEDWAGLFAEIVQNVINELEAGNRNALSEFMQQESERVLGHVPTLKVPGARSSSEVTELHPWPIIIS